MTMLEKNAATDVSAEQTRPAPVFQPPVDIYETDEMLVVLADLPGVKADELAIDLENDVLRLQGGAGDEAEGEPLLREYQLGRYLRQFTINEAIDRQAISAELKNGQLTLRLPKAAKAMPRKIQVSQA